MTNGAILSAQDIEKLVKLGKLGIDPYDPEHNLQSSSYDLRLSGKFLIPKDEGDVLDINKREDYTEVDAREEPFILHPDNFILGASVEYLKFPDFISGILFARSSIGRKGIEIHPSAGWFDAGFEGKAVFEISSVRKKPILLRPGIRIGQMVFVYLTEATYKPYDGKYKGQNEPVGSLIHKDKDSDILRIKI